MKYLDKISSPLDLRQLKTSELDILAGELREYLIQSVSKTGGHLTKIQKNDHFFE